MKSKNFWYKINTALLYTTLVSLTPALHSAEINSAQARIAAQRWRMQEFAPMGMATLGHTITTVTTVTNHADNTPLFHVVALQEGGFIVTSADDNIKPVIAFAESGSAVAPNSPLYALLERDMQNRKAAIANPYPLSGTLLLNSPPTLHKAEWSSLLNPGIMTMSKRTSSPNDVRIAPLLKTRWDQVGDYNRYYVAAGSLSSENYPAGCVAVCGAQIMKYHAYPQQSVIPATYQCRIDNTKIACNMEGGTYSWSSMPDQLNPRSSSYNNQSLAISKLIFDVAVAVKTEWAFDGSSALMTDLQKAFTERFHYAAAHYVKSPSSSQMRDAIFTNLDFGIPSAVAILSRSDNYGHAVVADGYGIHGGTYYTHLNMGWEGTHNAWYNLPLVDASPNDYFETVYGVIHGISPNNKDGAYCSGRVIDRYGNPINNFTLQLLNQDGSLFGSYPITTTKGSYSIFTTFKGSSVNFNLSVQLPGYKGTTPVTLKKHSSTTVGNLWGADIHVNIPLPYEITLNLNGGHSGTTTITTTPGNPLPYGQKPPLRSGYTFTGYYSTSSSSGGVQYYDANMNSTRNWSDTSLLTLYARWTPNTYNVTLDPANESNTTTSLNVRYDSPMPVAPKPHRTGYTFLGYFDPLGTQYYSATMTSLRSWDKPNSANLVAHWQANTYTIHLNPQGGTVTPTTKNTLFNSPLGALPTPVHNNLYFAGWWSAPNGNGWRATRSTRLTTTSLTLYAYWVSDPQLAIFPYFADPADDGVSGTIPLSANYEGFAFNNDNTIAGTLTLTIKGSPARNRATGGAVTNWRFTAKVLLKNTTIRFSDKTSDSPTSLMLVSRKGETLSLMLGTNHLYGELSGGSVGIHPLNIAGARNAFADKRDLAAQTRLASLKGLYNVALLDSQPSDPESSYQAHPLGHLSIKVGNQGTLRFAGKLADGASVSGSAKLLEELNEDGWYAMALYKPLYSKRGFLGGLMWLNPHDRFIRVDTNSSWFMRWECHDPRRKIINQDLSLQGGWFHTALTTHSTPEIFTAALPVDLPPPLAGLPGSWITTAFPTALPITTIGSKWSLPKSTPPRKVAGEYIYNDQLMHNPSAAKLTTNTRTGAFKGSYKLYYDAINAKGTIQHKTVNIKYAGLLVPDEAHHLIGFGSGTATINRKKIPIPVLLMTPSEVD